MPETAWQFPGIGCSCSKFVSQFARRRWVGESFQYWAGPQYITVTPDISDRLFRRFYQEWYFDDNPNVVYANFTREFSTECETYGDVTQTSPTPGPILSGGVLPFDRGASNQLTQGDGTYIFTNREASANPMGAWDLQSFTPGDEMIVELRARFTSGSPQIININRRFDREISRAEMRSILMRDMLSVEGGASACALSRARGGGVEGEDVYFMPVQVSEWLDGTNRPLPIVFSSSTSPPSGNNGLWLGGQAMLHFEPKYSTGWNFAMRSTLLSPGRYGNADADPQPNHSIQTVPLADFYDGTANPQNSFVAGRHGTPPQATQGTQTLACENIAVGCDEYLIETPDTDQSDRRQIWIEGSLCPNG